MSSIRSICPVSSADNARQAAAKVKVARDEADASCVVVQQAISVMDDIEGSSRKDSQIFGVIDEIAFQANPLALNAGVDLVSRTGTALGRIADQVQAIDHLMQQIS